MNYVKWVREQLGELSKSLGFQYITREELHNRLSRLRKAMEKHDMEAFLVVQKMDCYYLSGKLPRIASFTFPWRETHCLWSGGNWSVPRWNRN